MKDDHSRKESRSRILEATMALLQETHNISTLTVRMIAKKAGVGVGLVNYHFGDKQNLVRESVRVFIGRQIIKGYGMRPPEAATLRGRIAALLRGPMDFLAEFPRISRVSILYDLSSPAAADNSDDTYSELEKALRSIMPVEAIPPDFNVRLWAVMGMIHEAFLRQERLKTRTGYDFSIAKDRDGMADFLAGYLMVVPQIKP
jgi:AcrR family transcriptional regulator